MCKMLENDDRESYRRGIYMFVVNIINSKWLEVGVLLWFYFNMDELGILNGVFGKWCMCIIFFLI